MKKNIITFLSFIIYTLSLVAQDLISLKTQQKDKRLYHQTVTSEDEKTITIMYVCYTDNYTGKGWYNNAVLFKDVLDKTTGKLLSRHSFKSPNIDDGFPKENADIGGIYTIGNLAFISVYYGTSVNTDWGGTNINYQNLLGSFLIEIKNNEFGRRINLNKKYIGAHTLMPGYKAMYHHKSHNSFCFATESGIKEVNEKFEINDLDLYSPKNPFSEPMEIGVTSDNLPVFVSSINDSLKVSINEKHSMIFLGKNNSFELTERYFKNNILTIALIHKTTPNKTKGDDEYYSKGYGDVTLIHLNTKTNQISRSVFQLQNDEILNKYKDSKGKVKFIANIISAGLIGDKSFILMYTPKGEKIVNQKLDGYSIQMDKVKANDLLFVVEDLNSHKITSQRIPKYEQSLLHIIPNNGLKFIYVDHKNNSTLSEYDVAKNGGDRVLYSAEFDTKLGRLKLNTGDSQSTRAVITSVIETKFGTRIIQSFQAQGDESQLTKKVKYISAPYVGYKIGLLK